VGGNDINILIYCSFFKFGILFQDICSYLISNNCCCKEKVLRMDQQVILEATLMEICSWFPFNFVVLDLIASNFILKFVLFHNYWLLIKDSANLFVAS
jgi:hypothetical protein